MDTPADIQALFEHAHNLFAEPSTWWQLSMVAGGFLIAWLLGNLLQQRLQPIVEPGRITEVGRTAVRTGMHALVPIVWWLLLLATRAVFEHRGIEIDVLQTATVLIGALAGIRMGVFVLRHSFSPGSRLKAWEWSLTVTIWGLVALHLLGLLPAIVEMLNEHAVTLGQSRISLYTVVSFILSIAFLSLIALWLTNGIQSLLRRTKALDDSLKLVLSKLTRFILLSLAVVVAMVMAGIDLTALAVFGGALGVGLGLGLQRIVSNFVSGIILAFEESIHIGDVLNIGNTFGEVKALHARHIVVRDRDGRDILIPNETLISSEIINWSYGDRNVRFRLPVQISYQDDPEEAMTLMVEAARGVARVLTDPEPVARLMAFGDSGINLELRLWIHDPENGVNNVRSEVFLRIWRSFRQHGITIPFPQRDVHLIPESAAPATRQSGGTRGSRPGSGHDRMPDSPEADPD